VIAGGSSAPSVASARGIDMLSYEPELSKVLDRVELFEKLGPQSGLQVTRQEKLLAIALQELQKANSAQEVRWIEQCRTFETRIKQQAKRLAQFEAFLALVKRTIQVLPSGSNIEWLKGALQTVESEAPKPPPDIAF
jgi:hypothetical protein